MTLFDLRLARLMASAGAATTSCPGICKALKATPHTGDSMDEFLELLITAFVSCLHIPGSSYSPLAILFQLIFLHHRSYQDEIRDYWLDYHIINILARASAGIGYDHLASEVASVVGTVSTLLQQMSEFTGESTAMWVAYYMGMALRSEERLCKSFDLASTPFFKHRIAMMLGNIAAASPNDHSKSERYYGLAKAAAEELDDHAKLLPAIHRLGEQMLRAGKFKEARNLEEQLRATTCTNALCLAHAASLSASIAGFVGDDEASMKYNDEVITLLSGYPTDVAGTQRDLFFQDRPDAGSVIRAKSLLEQARDQRRKEPAEYEEAEAAEMLRDATSDDEKAGCLLRVALIAVRWCCLDIADSMLEEVERLGRRSNPSMLLRALNDRGLLFQHMGRHDITLEKLEEAARLQMDLDNNFGNFSVGRISYLEEHKRSFRLLQPLLLKFGAPERRYEAVVWGERERARDLLYSMRYPQERKAYRQSLAEFDSDNSLAWEEIKDIVRQAGDDAVVLFASTYDKDTVIVTHLLHSDKHWHITIKIENTTFKELLRKTRENMGMPYYGNECLKVWYGMLIAPHESALKAVQPKRLIIIPQEEVSLVPFAALFEKEGGPYLIERYAISVAPSLRMYKHCTREAARESDGNSAAATVIRPEFVRADMQLPGAEEEADNVAQLLGSLSMQVTHLQGASAHKEAVMNAIPASSWVHIASHAIFSESLPNGAILLALPSSSSSQPPPSSSSSSSSASSSRNRFLDAGGAFEQEFLRTERTFKETPDSELLKGEELASWAGGRRLETKVVVLSACETGLGVLRSEGVLGLTRGFHLLGVSTVVASLWKVCDAGTVELMKAFYHHLRDGKDAGLALQAAIVGMIHEEDDFGHRTYEPYHWAPFFICGTDKVWLTEAVHT